MILNRQRMKPFRVFSIYGQMLIYQLTHLNTLHNKLSRDTFIVNTLFKSSRHNNYNNYRQQHDNFNIPFDICTRKCSVGDEHSPTESST